MCYYNIECFTLIYYKMVRVMKKELLGIVVIVSIVSLSSCGTQTVEQPVSTSIEADSDASMSESKETAMGSTEIENENSTSTSYTPVTVDKMLLDLKDNAYNASIKYKDQYFDITGIVDSIDADGEYFMLKADDADTPLIRCNINSDSIRKGLTTISIGGLAETCGIITGVDPEDGYSFDVASVKAGTEDAYTDFLDRNIQGLIQYKIPEEWTKIENSENEDSVYQVLYENVDHPTKDDLEYMDGIGIMLFDLSEEFEEGQGFDTMSESDFSLIGAKILQQEDDSLDNESLKKLASTFRTVKQGNVYGEIVKYSEHDSIYSELAWFAVDNTHLACILYETVLNNPKFAEEANLVLNSLRFPAGISFQSENEIVNMDLAGETSVFGTIEDLQEGKGKSPSEDQSTGSASDDKGSNDNKTAMYSIYEDGNQITLSQYQQIKEGMTYQKVVDIVGSEGALTADSNVDGEKMQVYTWIGKDSYAVAEIGFQNGKVISMTQVGLK